MDYRLELLDESTFERIINRICQKILGIGTISFAKGKDGGRDGKFTGTANNYPSSQTPWVGKMVIQVKHSENPIASCGDSDFKSLIKKEISKVNVLKANGDIDCYFLFTNRKYSGVSGEKLLNQIKKETKLENVVIIGKESINDLYVNPNKDIIREFSLDINHIPFDFSDQEIKDIIGVFRNQLPQINKEIAKRAAELKYDFDKISMDEKNKKNKLSHEYYENEILAYSLQDFEKIQSFLADPINENQKDEYFDIAAELRQNIHLKRDNFASFEELFIFIYKKICDGSSIKGKRHILTLLHYMYFECLIGVK